MLGDRTVTPLVVKEKPSAPAFSFLRSGPLLFHTYPQPRGENVAEHCPASCGSLGPRGSSFTS